MMKQMDSILKMKFCVLFLLIFRLLSPAEGFMQSFVSECPVSSVEPFGPRVFITVSSLAYPLNSSHFVERQLELNWYNVKPTNSDWVGLFDTDPYVNWTTVLDKVNAVDYTEGYYRTFIMLPYYDFIPNDFKHNCLNFWIGYFRDDKILASNCLKIQPTWMWDSRDIIGNFSISNIMIPGTHNSGSYQRYDGTRSENILARYKMCHDEDIWTQLVFGIRHLDLRIGCYTKLKEKYWLNHEYLRVHPFRTSLEQIKMFLNSTKEIVIMDFHRFPVGFRNRPDHHLQFIAYLEKELKEFMIPRSYSYDIKLNQLWTRDQRLLVMYSNEMYSFSEYLWPGLPQVWASTTEDVKLQEHIQKFISYSTPSLWAAMAELTPTIWEVLANPKGSLRIYADNVNRNVTRWFRDLWWDKASIIATDFFHGNNIIDVAIDSNKKRRWCSDYLSSRTLPVTEHEINSVNQEV